MTQGIDKPTKIFVMKSKEFHAVKVDAQSLLLQEVPWIIPIRMTVKDTIKRLGAIPLNTLFVVDDDNQLAGVITSSEAVAIKCKGGAKGCQELCDTKCASRGGCAFICFDPWASPTVKCRYDCNDQFDTDSDLTIDEVWF
jgi:hypothetical protein